MEQMLATFLFRIQLNRRKSTTLWLIASNDNRFENWRIILTLDHGIKPFVFGIVMIVLLSMSGRDKNTNHSKYEQRYNLLGSGWVKKNIRDKRNRDKRIIVAWCFFGKTTVAGFWLKINKASARLFEMFSCQTQLSIDPFTHQKTVHWMERLVYFVMTSNLLRCSLR